jgi:hypothetical protein
MIRGFHGSRTDRVIEGKGGRLTITALLEATAAAAGIKRRPTSGAPRRWDGD